MDFITTLAELPLEGVSTMELLGTVVGEVWDQVGEVVNLVKGEALLLLPIGVSFTYAVVKIGKKLFRFKG